MTEHTHPDPPPPVKTEQHGGHGHSWMMIACCIPMLVIAGGLVAAGVVSPGFLLYAVGCTAIMALMMRGMNHGSGKQAGDDQSTHAGHGPPRNG